MVSFGLFVAATDSSPPPCFRDNYSEPTLGVTSDAEWYHGAGHQSDVAKWGLVPVRLWFLWQSSHGRSLLTMLQGCPQAQTDSRERQPNSGVIFAWACSFVLFEQQRVCLFRQRRRSVGPCPQHSQPDSSSRTGLHISGCSRQ